MASEEIDGLYGLPLDRFVPERRALATSLRSSGQRDEATKVAALRRPSVAAWAVNQLVRTQPKALRELFDAGDALREAQDAVLAGGGAAAGLRDVASREREAVDALVDLARGLLDDAGNELSAPTLDRVADTLNAAALDDAARAAVQDGRLERELRHAGFGLGGGLAAPATAPARRRPGAAIRTRERTGKRTERDEATGANRSAEREHAEAERAERERRRAEAERAARERAAAHREARTAEADARRAAERAAKALQVAEERRDRAQTALDEAEAEVTDARARADDTAEAHREARERLDAT